jgi:hypothetical protein
MLWWSFDETFRVRLVVLLCYKIWIKSSPDQSWQAFQTGYRLREAMSPKLDLAGIPERRDTVVLASILFK